MQKASRSMGGKSKSLLPSHKQKPFGIEPQGGQRGTPSDPRGEKRRAAPTARLVRGGRLRSPRRVSGRARGDLLSGVRPAP